MANDEAKIMELLKQLQAEGAKVKDAKSDSELTADAMKGMGAAPEFEAWVTWTKRF